MTTNTKTKATLQLRLRGLIAGTAKHFPNGTLTFGGASYTPAQLTQAFQSLDDATTAMDAARSVWRDAVTKQRGVKASVGPLMTAYRSYLTTLYGNASATLGDFGVTPRKERTPLTTSKQAAAIAKSEATRAARHTVGSKQKQAIKGTVTTPAAPTAAAPTAPAKPAT